jgi:hypothetical protein
VVGIWFSIRAVIMLGPSRAFTPAHWTDIWAYGVFPLAAYAPLAGAGAAVWLAPRWTALGMAVSLVALLLLAIRNAWDLVTWISAKGDTISLPAEPGP